MYSIAIQMLMYSDTPLTLFATCDVSDDAKCMPRMITGMVQNKSSRAARACPKPKWLCCSNAAGNSKTPLNIIVKESSGLSWSVTSFLSCRGRALSVGLQVLS